MGIAEALEAHELVGKDAGGELCACGHYGADRLEHLGAVTVSLLGVEPRSKLLAVQRAREARGLLLMEVWAREDAEWLDRQQVEQNLRSFQVQPKRKRTPTPKFLPWQLAVAIEVLERGEAA